MTRAPPITAHLEAAGGQVEVGGGRGVAGLQPHHQRGGGRVEYGGGGHLRNMYCCLSLLYNPHGKYHAHCATHHLVVGGGRGVHEGGGGGGAVVVWGRGG